MLEKIREALLKDRISSGLERGYRITRSHLGTTTVVWINDQRKLQTREIFDKEEVSTVFAELPKNRRIMFYFGDDSEHPEVYWPQTWKKIE